MGVNVFIPIVFLMTKNRYTRKMCVFLFIWFFFYGYKFSNMCIQGEIEFFLYLKLKSLSEVGPKHTTFINFKLNLPLYNISRFRVFFRSSFTNLLILSTFPKCDWVSKTKPKRQACMYQYLCTFKDLYQI